VLDSSHNFEDEEDLLIASEKLHLPEDILILHFIATGLLQLRDRVERDHFIRTPFPAVLQRGLDRLNAFCYRKGHPLVLSIVELFEWCRRPMSFWPLQYELAELDGNEVLLDESFPTSICDSLACVSRDIEADLSEQLFIDAIFSICRRAGKQESYVAFRRLFIEHPVLTDFQFHEQFLLHRPLKLLKEPISEAYEPAPVEYLFDETYYGCPYCGDLLLPQNGGQRLICENEMCRRTPQLKPPVAYPADQGVKQLKRGLRRYISLPGQSEIWLEQQLLALGLEVELWPEFDAYDVLVRFPDGVTTWAIDVKDWASPYLLAHHVDPIPKHPRWDRAYYAFPSKRELLRPDYPRAFSVTCNALKRTGKGHVEIDGVLVHAAFDHEVVEAAKLKLQGGK
jgi:hypothetical protein